MNRTETDRHGRQVDALLQGMGNGTPPEGMERRIAAAVRMAAAGREAAVRPSSSKWTHLLRWTVWSPVLAVLLVALLGGSYAVWHQPYRRSGSLRLPPSKDRAARVAAVPALERNATAPAVQARRRNPLAASTHRPRAAFEAAPAAQLQQASFPAPPLPMTQQERLLLKLVRRSDPVLVASLTPEAREAERKREKEEVRKFFAPPPPLDEAGQ